MTERLENSSGVVVLGCHRGSHEALFERILGIPTGKAVILGGDDLGDNAKKSLDGALEKLSAVNAGAKSVERPRRVAVLGAGISGLAAAGELARAAGVLGDLAVLAVEFQRQICRSHYGWVKFTFYMSVGDDGLQ